MGKWQIGLIAFYPYALAIWPFANFPHVREIWILGERAKVDSLRGSVSRGMLAVPSHNTCWLSVFSPRQGTRQATLSRVPAARHEVADAASQLSPTRSNMSGRPENRSQQGVVRKKAGRASRGSAPLIHARRDLSIPPATPPLRWPSAIRRALDGIGGRVRTLRGRCDASCAARQRRTARPPMPSGQRH